MAVMMKSLFYKEMDKGETMTSKQLIQDIIDDLRTDITMYGDNSANAEVVKRKSVILGALETLQRPLSNEKNIEIYTASGCEGPHIALNQYRVAGPKAWGGGKVTQTWRTSLASIAEALRGVAVVLPVPTKETK